MIAIRILIFLLFVAKSFAQKTSIKFETHGKTEVLTSKNPFQKFIGEWTLKNDKWTQNWGDKTEIITIPNHHTISTQINTSNSILSIIDGPEPNGHIFWSYNPVTKKVSHLSSFGAVRAGIGEGSVSKNGDVTLKITFEGEPQNTYRIYEYKWMSKDMYFMKSVQYNSENEPTGLFYQGTFVRKPKEVNGVLKNRIKEIMAILDNNEISVEEQLQVYSENIVHMAPGQETIRGRARLGDYLKKQRQFGISKMQHKIVDFEEYDDIVIMQGEVVGSYQPKNKTPVVEFRTKNLFLFEYENTVLKIKKVIYNSSPPNHK
ncbi:hypothetical protein ACFSQJ_01850 [Croceitalea marina]|uniref:DUF4440 domain-containing protein n=1 Tax=Croceitalea marina TaxID=1775166 RepID=A0ABW5MU01_9FLAO